MGYVGPSTDTMAPQLPVETEVVMHGQRDVRVGDRMRFGESWMVRVKRVYEAPAGSDGTRILVDRIWPRGLSREKAHIDLWLRDLGPSEELRKWFGHDPDRWLTFKSRYFEELEKFADALKDIKSSIHNTDITLLYAARDRNHNNALALMELLKSK